jgi:integrase
MRLAVSNRRYWEGRVYRESYVRGGRQFSVPEYYCKLNHAGKRHAFNLGTANKEAAAEKARTIWELLVQQGWPSVLQKYAPTAARTNLAPTAGQFLAEVERTAGLKPRTFHRYAVYFRSLVAQIAGIKDQDDRRYDYRTGGRAEWVTKVDGTSLEKLTPEAAADWKAHYLARAGNDPLQQTQTARAFNAALRSAKSLFSSRIINADNFRVHVPKFKTHDSQVGQREIYWFENLTFEKSGSMKFSPPEGVTHQSLIVAARSELRSKEPDAYLLFMLCLCTGLRRAEADVLKWDQLHFGPGAGDCYIAIEANEFIQPKHGSGGRVSAEPELLKELLSFKGRATSSFVVNSHMAWKSTVHFRYRCEPHWKVLNTWLAGKGITDRKKIHTLRKMFGDAITKKRGIFAAATELRHTSLQVTMRHYTDPHQHAPLSVAGLLTDAPVKLVPANDVEEIIDRIAKLPRKSINKILKGVTAILDARRSPSARNTARPKAELAA